MKWISRDLDEPLHLSRPKLGLVKYDLIWKVSNIVNEFINLAYIEASIIIIALY